MCLHLPQIQQIPLLIPLAIGAVAVVCTVVVHAFALKVSLMFLRRQRRLGRIGAGFWTDVGIVSLSLCYGLIAHLVGIGLWAALFVACGEFSAFGIAYYLSAVNYTTLGYGDVILSPSWKLLGPLEAANGALMFGLSTAMIYALIQRLVQIRFADLN